MRRTTEDFGIKMEAPADPAQLPLYWNVFAELLRPFAPEVARAFETAATHLEDALQQSNNEPLTLVQAGRESGYSRDHLGRLVRAGRLPNAGSPNAPRIRRCDLPIKPGHLPEGKAPRHIHTASKEHVVRSFVANSKQRGNTK